MRISRTGSRKWQKRHGRRRRDLRMRPNARPPRSPPRDAPRLPWPTSPRSSQRRTRIRKPRRMNSRFCVQRLKIWTRRWTTPLKPPTRGTRLCYRRPPRSSVHAPRTSARRRPSRLPRRRRRRTRSASVGSPSSRLRSRKRRRRCWSERKPPRRRSRPRTTHPPRRWNRWWARRSKKPKLRPETRKMSVVGSKRRPIDFTRSSTRRRRKQRHFDENCRM